MRIRRRLLKAATRERRAYSAATALRDPPYSRRFDHRHRSKNLKFPSARRSPLTFSMPAKATICRVPLLDEVLRDGVPRVPLSRGVDGAIAGFVRPSSSFRTGAMNRTARATA